MFFHMYIALGQGQTTLCGRKSNVNRKALSLYPFVASLKKISFEVWFYMYFCLFLYMYIAPGQGQTTPWGQNFYFNINLLSLVICCKFLLLNDFLTVFFPYKSIRDQIWPCCKIGQGRPRVIIWTKYDWPESPMLHTKPQGHWPFGSGEENFWGQNFYFNINLLSLVICCKFLLLNDFLTVFFSHIKA